MLVYNIGLTVIDFDFFSEKVENLCTIVDPLFSLLNIADRLALFAKY